MYDQAEGLFIACCCFLKRVCPLLIILTIVSCSTFDVQEKPQQDPSFRPVVFFQKYISPVDGDRCRMHPSCSEYSIESIRKYGVLKGWIMSCDRLMRCGRDELYQAPPVIIRGEKYCSDPVENNVFWWVENSPIGVEYP